MITLPPQLRRRCAPLLAVVGMAALLLSACSADPPGTALPGATDAAGPSASPSAALDPDDALLRYARCMREHGVDVPDPVDGRLTVDGTGLTADQMEAAQGACEKWQRMAESQDGGEPLTEAEKQAFLDQAQCMRDRGWNVSDPVFDDNGGVRQQFHAGGDAQPGEPKPGDPTFEGDLKECAREAGVHAPSDGDTETDES